MIRKVLTGNNFKHFNDFNWKEFAIDTETTSLRQDELVLTGVSLCDGKYNLYLPIGVDWNFNSDVILELLHRTADGSKIVMHNSSFDMRVLMKYGMDFTHAKIFDTMIAAHLEDENQSKSLKELTRNKLCREVADFNADLSHYDVEFFEYALDDSLNTWDLYKYYLPLMMDDSISHLFFKIEMPFQKVLAQMETTGVLIDIDKLELQKEHVNKEKERFYAEMHDFLNDEVGTHNFNSPKQVIVIFERLGIEITEKTPSGNPSVGRVTLEQNKSHPFVELLINYKKCAKLSSAFLEPMEGHIQNDGRIRPSFNDTGTRTGRLSCSNPNLQQLPNSSENEYSPARFRELFIPPTGYKFISGDYSGQEVAVAAQVSKDPTLVESLNNGYDMHLAIANQFYNLGIPQEALVKSHPKYEMYEKMHHEARRKAKTITFGLMYGKGAFGFSKDFGISEAEAQDIVDKYFEGMPVLKKSIDDAHQELKDNGYVTNLAGRKRNFTSNDRGFYPGAAFRQAYNFKIQGYSADMIRGASVNIWNRAKNHPEWDLKQVMTVHDEVNFIVREEFATEAQSFIKHTMEDTCKNFIVPVKADVKVGDSYEETK